MLPPPPSPVGSFDAETGLWTNSEPWRCDIGGGRTLMIAPGFRSDGASVPRILWGVVGPQYAPDTFPAAFCHDALYAAELVERGDADDVFYQHLIALGVRRLKALLYWRAVRMAGWIVWRRHTEESIAHARQFAVLGSVT